MHENPGRRTPSSVEPATPTVEHPAEAFLRAEGLSYERREADPDMLDLTFDLDQGPLRALLHRHPGGDLLVLHLWLPCQPSSGAAARATVQLCQDLNATLPAGRFSLDDLDNQVTFRGGHFYGSEGLATPAFRNFFTHCLSSAVGALPSLRAVATGTASPAEALGWLTPPGES